MLAFFIRRVTILAAAVAVAAFLLAGRQPLVPIGVLVGSALSLYRIRLHRLGLERSLQGRGMVRSTLVQFASQLLILGFLAASALVNQHFFAGGAIGMLLLAVYICVNALTERLGLTRNHWGEQAAVGPGGE